MVDQSRTLPATSLRKTLDRAARLVRHTTIRQSWYDLGWRWLALLAGLLLADLVFALPVPLRWAGLLSVVVYPALAVIRIRARMNEKGLHEDQAARLVEEGHPELDNALINAVQFQRVVENVDEGQAALMRWEIERAETVAEQTPVDDVVSRAGEKRSFRLLGGFIGLWVLGSVLFSGVVFTILPRLFAPWLDDITPPYSLTKIQISPAGATVKYGGSVIVNVAVSGPIPENLTLSTRTSKGDWRDVALESIESGKYAITLDGLREDTWIVARGGGARSAKYLLAVALPPMVEEMEAVYRYPKYTGLKDSVAKVGQDGIHGFRDTKVTLKVTANRELKGGELMVEYEDGRTVQAGFIPDSDHPNIAHFTFPITGTGTFKISLTSADGQTNPDAAKGKIVLDKDERPTVWFNEPASEIVVTPDMKVAIDVEAEDDLGVQKVAIHRLINEISDNSAKVYEGVPVKRIGDRLVMDLADLGVRPGDEITYYCDAYDNDPGHPNYGQTEAYKMKVMSEKEYKEALKQQRTEEQLAKEVQDIKDAVASLAEKQQELAEKMEKLAQQLAKNPGDKDLQKKMQEAKAEQKKLQEDAEKMAQQLQDYAKSPSASEIESAIKKKVGEMAQSISKAAKEGMKKAQSGDPKQAAQGAKEASQALNQGANKAQQQVGKAIENIEKVAPLFQDAERFKGLLERQGQLVLQAREFQNSTPDDAESKSKMAEIAAEQGRIKEELKQLQEDFRRHAADAQKDFPKAAATANKIADEIGKRQIPNLMESGEDQFGKEQGPEGFENAQKALQEMQAMVGQCNGSQGECKSELDISLSNSLGKQGLGQSLSQCLNPGGQGMGMGMGSGQGSGTGSGSGGYMSPGSGRPMAGSSSKGPMAYRMQTQSLSAKSGSSRRRTQNKREGQPAGLSPDGIEVLPATANKPPKASDDAARGYPAEYRKMIRDYFVSVTKEKK